MHEFATIRSTVDLLSKLVKIRNLRKADRTIVFESAIEPLYLKLVIVSDEYLIILRDTIKDFQQKSPNLHRIRDNFNKHRIELVKSRENVLSITRALSKKPFSVFGDNDFGEAFDSFCINALGVFWLDIGKSREEMLVINDARASSIHAVFPKYLAFATHHDFYFAEQTSIISELIESVRIHEYLLKQRRARIDIDFVTLRNLVSGSVRR